MATTLTRDGGGCSGGHVIYLSPYYSPPLCARVSAFSLPLFTSYLLAAASPRGAILGTPTISSSSSLFPSFPLRLRRRLDRERKPGLASPLCSAVVSLCFSYFSSPSSAPPFCSPALSAHIFLFLCLLFPSFATSSS